MPTMTTAFAQYFTRTELNRALDLLGEYELGHDACPIAEVTVPLAVGGRVDETAFAVLTGGLSSAEILALGMQLGAMIGSETAVADMTTGALRVNDPVTGVDVEAILFRGDHIA